jgi:hypothetical protein
MHQNDSENWHLELLKLREDRHSHTSEGNWCGVSGRQSNSLYQN